MFERFLLAAVITFSLNLVLGTRVASLGQSGMAGAYSEHSMQTASRFNPLSQDSPRH